MAELKPGWRVKGIYNEACASEGHCPFYFGRDVEDGCRYYMVFRIQEGRVNDVDLAGITVIYNGDILYPKFADFMQNGSEGGDICERQCHKGAARGPRYVGYHQHGRPFH